MYVKLTRQEDDNLGAYFTSLILLPEPGTMCLLMVPLTNDSANYKLEWIGHRMPGNILYEIPDVTEVLSSDDLAMLEGIDIWSYNSATDEYEKVSYEEVFSFVTFSEN